MLNLARTIVLITALLIIAMGLLGGALGIPLSLIGPDENRLLGVTMSVVVLCLTVGLGLPLAWQAFQAIRGKPSQPFRPSQAWPLVLLFLLAVGAGHTILSLRLAAPLTFPPAHVAAMAAPPLAILMLAGRALAGATRWRDMVLQLSSGAFVSTLVAFSLEVVAVTGLLIAVLSSVAMQPGGQTLLLRLANALRDPTLAQDPAILSPLVTSPTALLAMGSVFVVAVPLIEEAAKTLGVGLLAYRRPDLAQAFLWGLAGGAGFALAEGLFNGATGLQTWAAIAVSRAGATLLHCLTGGLMGLAWYRVLAEARWGAAFSLYVLSGVVHGLWNGLALALTVLPVAARDAVPGVAGPEQIIASTGLLAILALFGFLAMSVSAGLIAITQHVKKQTVQS